MDPNNRNICGVEANYMNNVELMKTSPMDSRDKFARGFLVWQT